MRKTQTEISRNYVCSLSAISHPPSNPSMHASHNKRVSKSFYWCQHTETVRNSEIKGKHSFTLVAPQPHRQTGRQTDTHTDSMHPKLNKNKRKKKKTSDFFLPITPLHSILEPIK